MFKRLVAAAVTTAAVVAASLVVSDVARGSADPAPAPEKSAAVYDYRFVSIPDFMNADVADLRSSPGWSTFQRKWRERFPGVEVPNSWNHSYAVYIKWVLDAIEREQPDDVLIAGDLVNGHWGRDANTVSGRRVRTGVFGPTDTIRNRFRAVERAAEFYFGQHARLWTERGLTLHPAVGDHEYGDDPWRPFPFKRAAMEHIRDIFDRTFVQPLRPISRPGGWAHRTAYAEFLHPEVLLVTLDQFKLDGDMVLGTVGAQQLAWLERVLLEANEQDVDWILVQGHLPIVPHVRTRASSVICYAGGTSSDLWQTLADNDVDLYLNGEVHDNTVNTADGVTQISHGGLMGSTAFLSAQVTGETMDIELHRFVTDRLDASSKLYGTIRKGQPPLRVRVFPVPRIAGTMTVDARSGVTAAAGKLGAHELPSACTPASSRD